MNNSKVVVDGVKSIAGEIVAPCSKSYALRGVVLAVLSRTLCKLREVDLSGDIFSGIEFARSVGCVVDYSADDRVLIIDSRGLSFDVERLEVGESGFLARVALAMASLMGLKIKISGSGSILNRDFSYELDCLEKLGVECSSSGGKLPIYICSKVSNFSITMDCSSSSQFLSGLLMVAPYGERALTLDVQNLTSRGYIDMTLEMMNSFGLEVDCRGYDKFSVEGNQRCNGGIVTVEGDYSSISCLAVAGAFSSEGIRFYNLFRKSKQPDRVIFDVLSAIGAIVEYHDSYIEVRAGELSSFEFDATGCPDIFPALVALASTIGKPCRISGISRLYNKESNRAKALQSEFGKLGVDIVLQGDDMIIEGDKLVGSLELTSHNDHRIAMALAVTGAIAPVRVGINGAESVAKSYSEFWRDLDNILVK